MSGLPILEYAGWAAAALLSLLALASLTVCLLRRSRRSSQARTARALLGAEEAPSSSCSLSTDQSQVQPALALSAKVPCLLRFLYPLLALAAGAIYIWADVSPAATVNAEVKAAGAPEGQWEWSGRMASLTLLPAAEDAWACGARATAILLGILNGVWPFLQTLLLMTVWFLPGSCLSHAARGRFLRIFCALGKSGLSFPCLISIWAAVCQLRWRGDRVSADFSMSLDRGLLAFLLAAVLTNGLGSLADHYHFQSAPTTHWRNGQSAGRRQPLSSFSKTRLPPTLLCPLLAVATAASSVVTAFSVSLQGEAKPKIHEGKTEYIRSYSLMSFGLELADLEGAGACERILQVVFLATSLIIPLLLAGVLLAVWVLPLHAPAQNALLKVGHALDAWVALDVFAVVVAICSLDFGRITASAAHGGPMQEACAWMKRELSMSACMRAEVTLEIGFVMVALAAAFLQLLPKVALRACRRAIAKRDQLRGRAWASSVLTS